METVVIALGGNAISPVGEEADIPTQFERAHETAEVLSELVSRDVQPIVSHGNGPQVGELLRRVESASDLTYELPMDTCVADTMGGMGYMFQQALTNGLRGQNLDCSVATVISRSLVDADDPAFDNPTKPVGPAYTAEEAERLRAEEGWSMVEETGRGYRRVVYSPVPKKILERESIETLVEAGHLVITCGGGGVPVKETEEGKLKGVEAVIDKDRASSLLARNLEVDRFLISTDVDAVKLNFGDPDQRTIRAMDPEQAREFLEDEEFPPGSMGPKVEAAAEFVRATGNPACIGGLEELPQMINGTSGTRIEPDCSLQYEES